MAEQRQWRLGTQLALIALPFAALTLVAIVLTLWVSWQLDGGAAAVNEAGRLRMQAYRLSLSIATGDAPTVARKVEAFDEGLAVLRRGDPERPLFMPWDDTVRTRFASVERDWARFRVLGSGDPGDGARLRTQTAEFSAHIDALVDSIEVHMARWTAFMHLLQSSVLALVIAGGATLLAAGHRFVLEPVAQLKDAIQQLQSGDFDAPCACGEGSRARAGNRSACLNCDDSRSHY